MELCMDVPFMAKSEEKYDGLSCIYRDAATLVKDITESVQNVHKLLKNV